MKVFQVSEDEKLAVKIEDFPSIQNSAISLHKDSLQSLLQILNNLISVSCKTLILSYPSYTINANLNESDILSSIILNELEYITTSYWRLCANTSLDILGNVTEHFQTLVYLLKQTHSREVANRVCSLLGEAAQILG